MSTHIERTKDHQGVKTLMEWVIYPGDRAYPLTEKITVLPLAQLAEIKT